MKVVLITHGTYLEPDQVVVGNSVRAYYLARGLAEQGTEVVYGYPAGLGKPGPTASAPPAGISVRPYRGRQGLASLIEDAAPDTVIVGYWELMDELPHALSVPIVLDVVAPRVLEAMYEEGRPLDAEIERMLRLYRRADRFLAGNQRQRHFLLPWLIMAGFDCRANIPIDVIPISTTPGAPRPLSAGKRNWRFVSGGVSWPWRRTEEYFDALVHALHDLPEVEAELALFAGKYAYAPGADQPALSQIEAAWPENIVRRYPLRPYREMQAFLESQCDIGVELADRNIEREYSQSFRAVEFLRSGLPIICNDYLELAELITRYDAGWVVGAPSEVPELARGITASPETWRRKSENAIRLVQEQFDYRRTVCPLVEFVRHPQQPTRGQPLLGSAAEPDAPILAPRPQRRLRDRIKGRIMREIQHVLGTLRGRTGAQMVAMVTRHDIFPPDHGAAVKIERTAWGLSHQVDAVFVITDDRDRYYVYEKGVRSERRFPWWLRKAAPPRMWVRARLLRKGIPISDAFLYRPLVDWSYVLRTLYLGAKHPITVFQAEFPAYARACIWGRSMFGGRALLVEHNVEYQRLKEQMPALTQQSYALLRSTEVMLCNSVDIVIAVSERDRKTLVADGVDYRKVRVIPHGVDLAQFDVAQPLNVHTKLGIPLDSAILVYHGIYTYPPNIEAMQIMAREILPRLQAKGIKAKVLAIGRNPPDAALHEDIVFTGSVESVAPYLLAADVAVVPLQQGAGTRMKVLDYFAAGLPVVSTSKGIEGLDLKQGEQALIVDDFQGFSDAVAELLQDPARGRRLGAEGRRFVAQLDWRTIALRYLQVLGQSSKASDQGGENVPRPASSGQARIARSGDASDEILVYQMGKVGSQSVVRSLENLQLGLPIHHLHFLHDLDAIEAEIKSSWFNSPGQVEHVQHCRELRRMIDTAAPDKHWYVISLVRDPIAREISSFFYNTDLSNPDLFQRYIAGAVDMRELHYRFLETSDIEDPSAWFDRQVKPVFGIDVFATAFPRVQGYKIYRRGNISLLLLKLERLSECAGEAFKEFLGIDNFTLANVNTASDKGYHDIYTEFTKTLRLPDSYLRQAYSSRLVRHLYSYAEVNAFMKRWGGSDAMVKNVASQVRANS